MFEKLQTGEKITALKLRKIAPQPPFWNTLSTMASLVMHAIMKCPCEFVFSKSSFSCYQADELNKVALLGCKEAKQWKVAIVASHFITL